MSNQKLISPFDYWIELC